MIELFPMTLKEANATVKEWHRHHKPVVGHRYSIGAMIGDQKVGAIIIGNPVAEALNNGFTFEVTRLVTNGDHNVASRLLGAAWRSARAMGVKRMISYTREDEQGTCYKAAGWIPTAKVNGKEWTGGNKKTRLLSLRRLLV